MSAEELTTNFQQFGEVWNTGNLDLLDEVCAADLVHHLPPFPDMDLEALKQFIADFRGAFPDLHVTIDEDIVAGNTTAHRWNCRATHTGESAIMPIPPSGKQAAVIGCHVVHWVDGKAAEIWHIGDWLGWLQHLGVIPPLG